MKSIDWRHLEDLEMLVVTEELKVARQRLLIIS
jgi:hypothetical protein